MGVFLGCLIYCWDWLNFMFGVFCCFGFGGFCVDVVIVFEILWVVELMVIEVVLEVE